jgi:geranylgeranylglycerol-phosphate geranylgeranyltransferase
MVRTAVTVVCALTRLDTCTIVFLSLLLPLYFASNDLLFSLKNSLPVLTICMCGFVINDLSDIEKDRENHPNRPLPSQTINELGASIIYFTLLAFSLITIKLYVSPAHVYLYVLLLVALINYNYVVAYVPAAKNIYVATVGLIPIFILASLVDSGSILVRIAPSLFLFLLGREMLMDVEDSKGDLNTLANLVGAKTAENVAFLLKSLGSVGLCLAITGTTDAALVVLLVLFDGLFAWAWKRGRYRRTTIHLMKLQLLVGIYFVIEHTHS